MDWNNFINTASNIIQGVGTVAGAVLDEMGQEIIRNYMEILLYSNNGQTEFLFDQMMYGNMIPDLPREVKINFYNQSVAAFSEGRCPTLEACCATVAQSGLAEQCFNDVVMVMAIDCNMPYEKIAFIQAISGMLGLYYDDYTLNCYITTAMNNFQQVGNCFKWFVDRNTNKLPDSVNERNWLIHKMVCIFGYTQPSLESLAEVSLLSPILMRVFSFIFGLIGLDRFVLGHKGMGVFKLCIPVLIFIAMMIWTSASMRILGFGVLFWIIVWIADVVRMPDLTKKKNYEKSLKELPKLLG